MSNFAEKTETFDLSGLLKTTVMKYEKKEIVTDIPENIYLNGRKDLIRRSLNNLIDNSIKYGQNILISLKKTSNNNVFLDVY